MNATNLPLSSALQKQAHTLPGALSLQLLLTGLAALLLFIAVALTARVERQALNTLGRDWAPGVIVSQKLKATLEDMDAQVANELLLRPGQNAAAQIAYAKCVKSAGQNLVEAAEHIRSGDGTSAPSDSDAQRRPVQAIVDYLSQYQGFVDQAKQLHQESNSAFFAAYRQGTTLLHDTLASEADNLYHANHDPLDDGYDRNHTVSFAFLGLVLLHGGLLLVSLLYTQFFLFHRTHRVLNRGLLVATILALGLTGWTVRALVHTSSDLQVAKADAFDSLNSLWKARATAFDINGSESRWLLARASNDAHGTQEYQQQWAAGTAQLAVLPPTTSFDSLVDSERKGDSPTGFSGLLADEFGNITFAGERTAAADMLATYGRYVTIDIQIRQLEAQEDHQAAVALCCGNQPGQSDWAFEQFDDALGKVIDINQSQFDLRIQTGVDHWKGYEGGAACLTVLIVLAAYLGLRPRFEEYSGLL